ncbi:MAG: LPS assembly lipoprotein LptE [Verrucomicrobiae bacterium]|nr:LPS assembly lipoprotein LptE [Verrucomicrobiae bacterium]
MRSRSRVFWAGWCILVVGLTGCAGYRLGPSNGLAAGERSIFVKPFQNQTMEPRLGEPVTHALRKSLQQDGTFHLNTDGDADIVVTGTVTRFSRSPVSFQPQDLVSVQDYALSITARVKAVERASGKVILDREVTGTTTVRVGADLNSTERQATPLLAQDLARRITALLTDGDW